MLRKSLFLILLLCVTPLLAQDELRQWASSAEASSEYSEDGWSAQQATGEPDTEGCEDSASAWASKEQTNVEDLTVYFDTAVIPTEINIHQNFGRGSISGVELIPADGGRNITLRGTADVDDECPGVFTVTVEDVEDAVIGVLIEVDQRRLEKWNEIDAVELVGVPVEEETTEETSEEPDPDTSNSSNFDMAFGRSVNCEDGGTFDNGVEFTVVQMRVRSTYTVTAVGLGDFDPILAVLGDSGQGICNDDDALASGYGASLPTTGEVDFSGSSAQVVFTNRSSTGEAFRDVTFVVGGRNNQPGEFILIIEGLTLMYEDGIGDTISAHVTPSMITSGVPLTAYMLSVTQVFDPWIGLIDGERNFLRDDDKNYLACDDAGYNSCWGESSSLEGYAVSRSEGRALAGGVKDAMMTIPLDESLAGFYINYVMSTIQGTYGDYLIVFHSGVGEP